RRDRPHRRAHFRPPAREPVRRQTPPSKGPTKLIFSSNTLYVAQITKTRLCIHNRVFHALLSICAQPPLGSCLAASITAKREFIARKVLFRCLAIGETLRWKFRQGTFDFTPYTTHGDTVHTLAALDKINDLIS